MIIGSAELVFCRTGQTEKRVSTMNVSGLGYSLPTQNGIYQNDQKDGTVDTGMQSQSVKSKDTDKEKTGLELTIIEMAQKDAAKGVYMGPEYIALERSCVAKVAPNRRAAIAQVSGMLGKGCGDGYDLIEEIGRYVRKLFHLPYKADVQKGPHGCDTAQVYDEHGEMIAAYHWMNGWTSVPTTAEVMKSRELTFIYYDAYHDAREAMKKSGQLKEPSCVNILDQQA